MMLLRAIWSLGILAGRGIRSTRGELSWSRGGVLPAKEEPAPMLHARRVSPAVSLLLALLPLALAAACSTATPEEFDRRMAAYVGRPEAEVVASLGVPNRTYDGDGRRLLQYEFVRPSSAPAIFPSIGLGFGSGGWGGGWGIGTGLGLGFGGYGPPAAVCVLVFESRDGRITGFNRNGPGCVLPAA